MKKNKPKLELVRKMGGALYAASIRTRGAQSERLQVLHSLVCEMSAGPLVPASYLGKVES